MKGSHVTHEFCVDNEVTFNEWDEVRLEADGSANFYINVSIRDSDHANEVWRYGTDDECPVYSKLVNSYYSIPEGGGNPDSRWSSAHGDWLTRLIWDREVYRRALQPGPFLRVAPGGKKTKKFTLDHPDAKVEIWYTLTNHTARVRERQN